MGSVLPKNAKVKTVYLQGLEGCEAEVEVSIFQGLPSFEVVGLGDSSIKEAKERVRACIRACGYTFPKQRILVNISPAYLHKSGSSFDLPIALGILLASGQIYSIFSDIVAYGELSLTGEIKPVPGSISRMLALEHIKSDIVIIPSKDSEEASLLSVEAEGVSFLSDAIAHLEVVTPHNNRPVSVISELPDPAVDISCLRGQPSAGRAMILAAAGFHNLLFSGSPGTGKSLSAQIIQGLLPPLSLKEKIELLRVESSLSVLDTHDISSCERPFRYINPNCTPSALVGGGRNAIPGEISRALHGVLFLDELPEFSPKVLDLLRVPLESGEVEVSRNSVSNTFPAKCMLVAAMNPCRCGKCIESPSECTCTPSMIRNYQGRISGALLDRMDIYCYMSRISESAMMEAISSDDKKESKEWRKKINDVWQRQYRRCEDMGIEKVRNGECREQNLTELFRLGKKESEYAAMVANKMKLSVRGLRRLVRLSRTIADLDLSLDVKCEHIMEALTYRIPMRSESGVRV